ncbi:MAG: methylmalonyl Co-A mutase-associated GTPase MeaB [Bacteroidia bacterium]|nr:methylmalonyl Co-A mutase-associated GTPase MeaB [Bacteroidia bacterium]
MTAPHRLTAEIYTEGILRGDRLTLSRAITLIESTLPSDQQLATEIIRNCLPYTGNAYRVGITGVPGVGKSTFIDGFGSFLISEKLRVAVLAVDPSSSRSGGSILGDKTRMEKLAASSQAFIRPSPSGGNPGGVARKTRESILLCEAAGYEMILIETVGVGQSEISVFSMVDFFLLLLLPHAGDELQGIKRGIMEMADGLIIHKADGVMQAAARQAQTAYSQAIRLFNHDSPDWRPQIIPCSSLTGKGYPEIGNMLNQYKTLTLKNGFWEQKRSLQLNQWLKEAIEQQLLNSFYSHPRVVSRLEELSREVADKRLSPTEAAEILLKTMGES